jgi:hypothetical protein
LVFVVEAVAYGSFDENRHERLDRAGGQAIRLVRGVLLDFVGRDVLIPVTQPVPHLVQMNIGLASQFVYGMELRHRAATFESVCVYLPRIASYMSLG